MSICYSFFILSLVGAPVENGSFGFLSVVLCVGKNQICHLCGDFCINGLVFPDRTTKPHTEEMRKVYQNVWFEDFDHTAETVKIYNENFFIDLSQYKIEYEIIANEQVLKTGQINVDVKPQERKTVSIPEIKKFFKKDVQTLVNFYVKQKNEVLGITNNWIIARDQFIVNEFPKLELKNKKNNLNLVDDFGKLQVSGKDFVVEIDKETGVISSYKYKNLEFIKDNFGLRSNFWRAPLDNDYGAGMPKKLKAWKNASYDKLNVQNIEIINENLGPLTIKLTYKFEEVTATLVLEYAIYNNGVIKINNNFDATNSSLPYVFRVGLRMQMPSEFSDVEYYGRGPWSNYCDRKTSTFIGKYSSKIAEFNEKFVFAQEAGHHTDTRWLSISNQHGKGLIFHTANENFEFNVSDVLMECIDNGDDWHNDAPRLTSVEKKHIDAYQKSDRVDVFIDYKMQGVAGNNSWGALPEEQYKLVPKNLNLEYGFYLIPFENINEFRKTIK